MIPSHLQGYINAMEKVVAEAQKGYDRACRERDEARAVARELLHFPGCLHCQELRDRHPWLAERGR
jgi:hypothetical protein